MRMWGLLSRTALGPPCMLSVSSMWAGEVTTVSRLGWSLSYTLFKPILSFSLCRRIKISLQSKYAAVKPQTTHWELLVLLKLSSFRGRPWHLSASPIVGKKTFSLVTVSKWLINALHFTTDAEQLLTGDYRGSYHAWVGNDLSWRQPTISVLVTQKDFPMVARHRGSVCGQTQRPHGTPVFEVDTAVLSLLSTCCFVILLSNQSYFPWTVTANQR